MLKNCHNYTLVFQLDVIGQEKHGHAALALILVEYLRVTAMEMMNALITLCVDLIVVLIPFRLMLTVVLNLKSKCFVA